MPQCSYNLPIMLKIMLNSRIRIVLGLLYHYIQICINKSLHIANNVETRKIVLLGCIYKWKQNTLHVLLDNNCSNRVCQ